MEGKEMARKNKLIKYEMTSAYANKIIKFIENQISSMLQKENTSSTYVAALDEEPVIPDYDFEDVSKKYTMMCNQIMAIKHALNKSNTIENITVKGESYSVDMILVKMAQLNIRKRILEGMRSELPKKRISQRAYGAKNGAPEYQYTNYNPSEVEEEYCAIVNELVELQIELDKHNQTEVFEVYFDEDNIPFKLN